MVVDIYSMLVGVSGVQGDVEEHEAALREFEGVEVRIVKYPPDLEGLDALILPGGESTTMSKLMLKYGLDEAIKDFAKSGGRILGTCAGMVLLAKSGGVDVEKSGQPLFGLIDAEVNRNAFGRQRESFEKDLDIPVLGKGKFHGVFIRAPCYVNVGGGVEVLSKVEDKIVAVRSGNIYATSFHPEISGDSRFLKYFLGL